MDTGLSAAYETRSVFLRDENMQFHDAMGTQQETCVCVCVW